MGLKFGALVSYHYCKGKLPQQLAKYTVLDSGAFSAANCGAAINLTRYGNYMRRHRAYFQWAACLDVIGNPEATWSAWRAAPRSVPALHAFSDPAWLDRMAGAGATRVAFGGLVPHMKSPKKVFPWLDAAFREAARLGLKVHGFGVGNPKVLAAYPWSSSDSASWISPVIFNRPKGWANGKFQPAHLACPAQDLVALGAFDRAEARGARVSLSLRTYTAMVQEVMAGRDFTFYFATDPNPSADYTGVLNHLGRLQ